MTDFYFQHFPSISYDLDKTGFNNKLVTDTTVRYKMRDVIKNKSMIFYNYSIQEGERPDSVAFRWYEDETLDWIILIANDIIDPVHGWPLHYYEFRKFIESKYGSIASAQTTVHHYEQIIQSQQTLSNGKVIPEKVVTVDSTTYSSLPAVSRKVIYNYDYEDALNEAKRDIKILDITYLPLVLNEARLIFER